MDKRTITVTGTGVAAARPDEIELGLRLSAQSMEYKDAVALSARQHESIVAALAPCGIAREEIKTSSFTVDTVKEGERDANGNYKERFAGYRCVNAVNIAFPLDMERLGRILTAVSESGAEPELDISFTLHDKDSLKDEALRRAAAASRRRAELLCAASGVKLGELSRVDYSWGEVRVRSETNMAMGMRVMACKQDMALEPEDVRVEDTVTFTWVIE